MVGWGSPYQTAALPLEGCVQGCGGKRSTWCDFALALLALKYAPVNASPCVSDGGIGLLPGGKAHVFGLHASSVQCSFLAFCQSDFWLAFSLGLLGGKESLEHFVDIKGFAHRFDRGGCREYGERSEKCGEMRGFGSAGCRVVQRCSGFGGLCLHSPCDLEYWL
jgi:hypothetical protein